MSSINFRFTASLTMVICVSVQAATSYTYTSIDYSEATATYAQGVDGDNIVGWCRDSSSDFHGFKYDGSSYTSFDVNIDGVTVTDTYAYGIDGSNIVGRYYDGSGDVHGFQAIPVVPLPPAAWMALTMLGGISGYGLIRRRLFPVNTSL